MAIFLQNIVSIATFRQKKILNFMDYILYCSHYLGKYFGSFYGCRHPGCRFTKWSGIIVVMFMILLDPNTWVKSNIEKQSPASWVRFWYFWGSASMAVLYKSVSVFMLGGLVLGCGYDLLKANALKVLLSWSILSGHSLFLSGMIWWLAYRFDSGLR